MIRPLTVEDIPRVVELAVVTEMFPVEAESFLVEQATRGLALAADEGFWLVDELDGEVVGIVFCEPRVATDRVWELTMLAIDPRVKGTGRGSALIAIVETMLRDRGQRLLLIETSSTARYDRTRAFYVRNGYLQVAVVADYFEDGDDMVLFRKDLRIQA